MAMVSKEEAYKSNGRLKKGCRALGKGRFSCKHGGGSKKGKRRGGGSRGEGSGLVIATSDYALIASGEIRRGCVPLADGSRFICKKPKAAKTGHGYGPLTAAQALKLARANFSRAKTCRDKQEAVEAMKRLHGSAPIFSDQIERATYEAARFCGKKDEAARRAAEQARGAAEAALRGLGRTSGGKRKKGKRKGKGTHPCARANPPHWCNKG